MFSKNKLSWFLYGAGLFIVFFTHVYMLVAGIVQSQMNAHAVLNLVGGGLLVAGWLSRKN